MSSCRQRRVGRAADFGWKTLAARTEDPATTATRSLDWEPLVAALDGPVAAILCCLVAGADLTTLVPKLKRCRSSLQGDKQRLAQLCASIWAKTSSTKYSSRLAGWIPLPPPRKGWPADMNGKRSKKLPRREFAARAHGGTSPSWQALF